MSLQHLHTRAVPSHLAARYRQDGLWADVPLGVMIDQALRAHGEQTFQVHSLERPWTGSYAALRRRALALAGGLSARGVRPGDAVAFQLPNWVEAAVTYYATAFLGAVVVPIVHFYGPREVSYILRRTEVSAFITAAGFGRRSYLDDLAEVCQDVPSLSVVAIVGADNRTLPAQAIPFEALENIGVPLVEATRTDPDSPAIIAYTSGTTAAPKGVIHTHNTICAEANQLGGMNAGGDRPSLTGTPVGHFMGMQGGLQLPLRNGQPVHLIDVWDPARVLAIVAKHGLAAGSGSAYFLGSLLDHPDLTDDHMRHIRHVGLGGASIPAAFTEKAAAAGVSVVRMYGSTEHPSITGSRHEDDARSRWLVPDRGRGRSRRDGPPHDHRPEKGHHHPGRGEHQRR
ncbi:AMP-binding protein [Frankia sp. Ag45/Mut15]|uniref:AMP-binding protein n=1 Tax=Frankia umida TaxID=573489 RepID=A0ABT0K233_9ACTN|nr:AMP-binding protein [Frankia umida]MCK9877874.1 AMP-binding protein [Frankia umida]